MKPISIPTGRRTSTAPRPPRRPGRREPSAAARGRLREPSRDRATRGSTAPTRTAGTERRPPSSARRARSRPCPARSPGRRAARPPASGARRRRRSGPTSLRSSMRPRQRRWNSASPTASTSSTSRISGSRWAATANASRTDMPLEYRLTGVSMNCSTPANSTISSNLRCDLPPLHPEHGAVEEDVLAAGELGVEAGPDLEQAARRDRGSRRARSVGVRDAREDLEQRRLPRAVPPDDAEHLAFAELEGDVLQRPDLLVVLAGGRGGRAGDPRPPSSRGASRTRSGARRSGRASRAARRRSRSPSDRVRELAARSAGSTRGRRRT